jgi:gas vesicle protein
MSKRLKRLAISSGLAGLAGYLAGLLSAPRSGKQTRRGLKHVTDKSRYQFEKDLRVLLKELDSIISEAKKSGNEMSSKTEKELKLVVEKAQTNKEKIRELISAIHEGDAEDDDLKRTIVSANSALEHLKDYLKK